jgi:hypothetical protein
MEEVKTSEGFLVLKVSNYELAKATGTQYAICDNCCFDDEYGYYVAVLNSWLCPLCYAKWKKTATRYSEDIPIEERNYRRYKELISEVEKSSLYNYSGS